MLSVLRVGFLFALFLSLQTDSWSKPPSPAFPKTVTEPEKDAGEDQANSNTSQHMTQPFPAIVEIPKTPVIQVEAADKTEETRDYTSSEWWLVYLTAALAAITGALALYTGKLYRATVRLGEDARAQ